MINTSTMTKVTATGIDGIVRLVGWTKVISSGKYVGFVATESGPIAVPTACVTNVAQATSEVLDAAARRGYIY